MICCFFSSFKTLLTSTEGTALPSAINVLNAALSLAGFQVIIPGRFWVITEGLKPKGRGRYRALSFGEEILSCGDATRFKPISVHGDRSRGLDEPGTTACH
jgi:hypothetical protein